MKINQNPTHLQTTQRLQTPKTMRTNVASFSETLSAKQLTANTKEPATKQLDFSNMTRQQLFDWMNGELRSGRMSFEESSSFMAMTMKISVATGQPADMATDTAPIDFLEKARSGLAWAVSNRDQEMIMRLESILGTMNRLQGRAIAVDTQA